MTDYVFDTEPLIAYFYDEPGAAELAEKLQEVQNEVASGAIAHATAAEVAYEVARLETGDPNRSAPGDEEREVGERDIRVLQGFGLTIELPSWQRVAGMKAPGGISLGDCYAAALADEREATLVVGDDPEFDTLRVDIDLYRFPGDAG